MYNNKQQREFDNLKNEIARLKKIIEWYQATYEHRSILGVIKSKILVKKRKQRFFTKIRIKFENFFNTKTGNNFAGSRTESAAAKNIFKLKKQTCCVIANHNDNPNAKLLVNIFSSYLTTCVIDSGFTVKQKEFPDKYNPYYSGSYNYAYEYAKSKNYKYLLFVCSDVIVDEREVEKMFKNLSRVDLDDIGIYSPAFAGSNHYQCKRKNENGFRVADVTQRSLFFANMNVLENFSPIDAKLNLYGRGLDVAMGFYSKKKGLLNIIDDGVVVDHPDETGDSVNNIETQSIDWFRTLEYGDEIIGFYKDRARIIQSGLEDEMKISVIIPCYNQAPYLRECIYSIFSQIYSNYEIIIINDGSTDETDELATSLKNIFNQIKYVKQSNQGLGATRNKGLEIAQGNYIQFLDADDYLSNNKFTTAIQAFLKNSKLDIAYSHYLCFEDGNPEKTWTYSRVEFIGLPLADLIDEWERDLSIPIHCFLFKKEIINNLRFDRSLPNHEDWEFHLTIASKKPNYLFIPTATAHYRMKKIAMSQNMELMKDGKNRCIANIIASQKIQQEYLPGLYERFDYKIAIGIVSCNKNREKINVISNTWLLDLKRYKIPYYIIIGDPSLSVCKLDGDILYVPCADNYENLPQKVVAFYRFINESTEYNFVYKIDDDCFLNIEKLFSTYFWNFDYFGRTVATREEDLNKSWHSGKCNDPTLNEILYSRPYLGPWCGGGYGYFLSRKSLKAICSMSDYVATDLYEDKAIGDALRKKKITAEENVRYRILDITKFGINHKDEIEFKRLIDEIGYSILEYEVIVELQKEFQFRIIQEKKTELMMKKNKRD